jgi:hypothetical protein
VLETGFGALEFGINATYELNREQSPLPGRPFADLLENNASQWRMRASIGAQIQNFRAQLVWNHTDGYDLNPPVGAVGPGAPPQQASVDPFDVLNLFFKYDVKGATGLRTATDHPVQHGIHKRRHCGKTDSVRHQQGVLNVVRRLPSAEAGGLHHNAVSRYPTPQVEVVIQG